MSCNRCGNPKTKDDVCLCIGCDDWLVLSLKYDKAIEYFVYYICNTIYVLNQRIKDEK